MLSIIGMGYCHPTTVLDNKFIEDLNVGTSAQWIMEKIGIESRLTTLPLDYIRETRNLDPKQALKVASMTPTDLGVNAAKMALDRAGLKAEEIGLTIVNCCTPNQAVPAEAHRIAGRLGTQGKSYDVFTSCPAFALHMDFLNSFKPEKLPDYILCISTATITQHVNYNDRSDSAIWGDGAAAWIVSPTKAGKLSLLDTNFNADPTRANTVLIETWGHFWQDGRLVRDFSVRQTVRLIKRLEENFEIDWNKDIFVGHQANATMLRQIVENREIPETNHWHNVKNIGNQAGAGAPAVMAMNWDRIKAGQKIAVAVVGGGLSWGSVLLQANE